MIIGIENNMENTIKLRRTLMKNVRDYRAKSAWEPIPYGRDPELARMAHEAIRRGYFKGGKIVVIYERAYQQRINGDAEYNRSPTFKTIVRRVLTGEYDHLFN
jgi:hypothetical protein